MIVAAALGHTAAALSQYSSSGVWLMSYRFVASLGLFASCFMFHVVCSKLLLPANEKAHIYNSPKQGVHKSQAAPAAALMSVALELKSIKH
jgi:hypothetical protein